MNEILKATRKVVIRKFRNTNQALDKSLVFLGAGCLLFAGCKFLFKSLEDLSSDAIREGVNLAGRR